jgi:phage-related minor tail protein
MSDMQSMVDRMRSDENEPSQEEQEWAEKLINMLLAAVESGEITAEEAKDIIRKAPDTMDELSTTGGGFSVGGSTFTPGSGMEYAQALNQPKKTKKENKSDYTLAPSIPNRPSTGGFQYKDLWGESESLQESYAQFKKSARERNGAGQLNAGISIVRKKLAEVHKMMEYLATLKSDLSTAGMVNETTHTRKAMEKMTEMIKQIYIKHKKLK